MLRSGASPAPNYGEARGAESHADFVHKLRIVLRELNETSVWLRIIKRSKILKQALLAEIVDENTNCAGSLSPLSKPHALPPAEAVLKWKMFYSAVLLKHSLIDSRRI
jgi:four helix bundle protein